MPTDRINRYQTFDNFCAEAVALFKGFAAANPRHADLEKVYSFYVVPGGALGGTDKRLLEVFYGSRPFAEVTKIHSSPTGPAHLAKEFLAESGARLHFVRADSGLITCLLIPAFTEAYRQQESHILLDEFVEPRKLTRRAPAYWRALLSYMQCTCLEGDPTLLDHLRVFRLRAFKRLIIEGKSEARRATNAALAIVKFALTIGLSGFILLGYQRCSAKPDQSLATIESLKDQNRAVAGQLTAYKEQSAALASQVNALQQQVAMDQETLRALRLDLEREKLKAQQRQPRKTTGR